jgi:Outer membrane protein beta-barrel domain
MKTITLFLFLMTAFLGVFIKASSQVQGQLTPSPGYIVTKTGDTLRGFLQFRREKDLMKEVSFSKNNKEGFQVFTTEGLSAFQLDQDKLYRAIAIIDISEDIAVHKTVFAKAVVLGGYDLYSIIEDGRTYFIVKSDTSTYFLYENWMQGNSKVKGNYLDMLNFFSAGCEAVNSQVMRVPYSEKEIAAFIRKVNQCLYPAKNVVTFYHKPGRKINFEAFGGALLAGSRGQITGEILMQIRYPEITPKTSLNIGFHYSYTAYPVNTVNGTPLTETVTSRHTIFGVPLTLQYNFTSGIIQPYLYGGASAGYFAESPTDPFGASHRAFSASIVGGIGIEVHPYRGLIVKADYRYEFLFQYPAIGLAWRFG